MVLGDAVGACVNHRVAGIYPVPQGVEIVVRHDGRQSVGAAANEDWTDLYTFETGTSPAVAAEISGTEAAGETTIAVDADPTAAFTRGIPVYIQDTGTLTDGEWGRCSHSATAADIVTLMDGLTNAKDATDTIWTQAESMTFSGIDLTGLSYVRMIVIHSAATGSNIEFKATLLSMTDFE